MAPTVTGTALCLARNKVDSAWMSGKPQCRRLENHIAEPVQTKTDTIGTPDPAPIFNRSTVQ